MSTSRTSPTGVAFMAANRSPSRGFQRTPGLMKSSSGMRRLEQGRLRHRRLARLIGYCCEGAERLLVAEFMPNNSLARHLFNVKTKTMERSKCLRVACYIAEALEYCIKEHALYYDLNPHKVLFDEVGNPCLSCFGLVKNHRDERCFHTNIAYTPPGCLYGMASAKSMVFSFGILLRDLLSGKQISDEQAMDAILGTRIPIVLDSRLWGKCSAEGATALVKLAYDCLQYKPIDRPSIKYVIATLAQIQSNSVGPSNPMPKTGAR
ncbi:serine/threonine-protein kinase BSK1-like [Dioscorea cayenensis subsp. rotundata]|uniref:Serine/threonine-protein kinase BSK1-like n=1 Tax=Dioscorea cayennensis subsp. rotundata TaxID=55577 RepID=A0AB40C4D6_DIOCR|nr:serine/threonine-protein kinase BSK1-like [Dioscorea cayenensis subsp. rotundata]